MLDQVKDERPRPWAWFDHEIIDEYGPKIGAYGVAVYMALARFADQRSQSSHPSYETLQKRLGVSRMSIAKTLKRLESNGLIRHEQRRKGQKGRETNIYTLIRPNNPGNALATEVGTPQILTDKSLKKRASDSVSTPDRLTVSTRDGLTMAGESTTRTNVSTPDRLTVSTPGVLELESELQDKNQKGLEKTTTPPSPPQGEAIADRPTHSTSKRDWPSPDAFIAWWNSEIVPRGGKPFLAMDADGTTIVRIKAALKSKHERVFWYDRVTAGFDGSQWLQGRVPPMDGRRRFRPTLPWLLQKHHSKHIANYVLVAQGEWADDKDEHGLDDDPSLLLSETARYNLAASAEAKRLMRERQEEAP